MDAQNEINELRRKIRHHSRLYYVYDKPEISDYDFDMLMQRLKALEALEKVADGKATKIIIPSEIQGLAGLAASTKALVEGDKAE